MCFHRKQISYLTKVYGISPEAHQSPAQMLAGKEKKAIVDEWQA